MPNEYDTRDNSLSWSVYSHHHKEHSNDWYWTIGVLAVAGAGGAIYFGNVLFAAILLIGCFSLLILTARGPREHLVHIDEKGLHVDGTLYRHAELVCFDLISDQHGEHLVLNTRRITNPHLYIPLYEMPAQAVYDVLAPHVPHQEIPPRIIDQLAHRLGL